MIEGGLGHVVASDGHDSRHRPPVLRAAAEAIAGRLGEEQAREMCESRPASLVAGEDIDVPLPEEPVPARGLKGALSRFFSRS
jgi:protein-tyrosine phosphatase